MWAMTPAGRASHVLWIKDKGMTPTMMCFCFSRGRRGAGGGASAGAPACLHPPPSPSDPSWKHEEKCPLRREWGTPGKAPGFWSGVSAGLCPGARSPGLACMLPHRGATGSGEESPSVPVGPSPPTSSALPREWSAYDQQGSRQNRRDSSKGPVLSPPLSSGV